MTNKAVTAKERLASILRGAFSGPPTPLKDIPKRNGEHRALRQKSAKPVKPTKFPRGNAKHYQNDPNR